ncbi:hypothetical protein HOLDEFILI_01569 [Holdemania filiformis DSM 12042]|uniref:Uncharacterized protein n=1 Tax=Holdemania filiformis DSM 12042 TaxID=545696 RepID=B9Y6X6_9FIRM|nr:hypothetical protein HOLDEFILI_01569 [Holdemania filiformis DSM 12042]
MPALGTINQSIVLKFAFFTNTRVFFFIFLHIFRFLSTFFSFFLHFPDFFNIFIDSNRIWNKIKPCFQEDEL